MGLHNSLWWWWWFRGNTRWSGDCCFRVARAEVSWGSSSWNCAWRALDRVGFRGLLVGSWSSGQAGGWPQGGWGSGLGRQLSNVSEVIIDSAPRLWCLDRDISPQELVVAKGDSTGSIDTNNILVKLTDLDDDACFVGMWTCLVLNTYMVVDCKRW